MQATRNNRYLRPGEPEEERALSRPVGNELRPPGRLPRRPTDVAATEQLDGRFSARMQPPPNGRKIRREFENAEPLWIKTVRANGLPASRRSSPVQIRTR